MSTNQSPAIESTKNTADTAAEHVADAAKATRGYVADASNPTTNTAQQKKEEASRVLIADTAQTAREHVPNAADSVSKGAKPEKEETAGSLKRKIRTGTTVKNTALGAADTVTKTAQGAVETVKNTIGMNARNEESKFYLNIPSISAYQ